MCTRDKYPIRPKNRFLVFGAPAIEEAEIAEVVASLQSGWLGTGPKVARFEDDFRAYKESPYSVAVSSCTAGLHLSLLAAGIGPGSEVITSALTFCATVNAIIHSGATPVLVDVEPGTMNLDPKHVKAKLTSRTRAVIPVHFAGRPCNMESLCHQADHNGLVLIEDCAHAIETQYRGKHVGTFGDFGCFSFYVTKNIVTGEGGMVLTRKCEHADKIKTLALHGLSCDAWERFSDKGYKHYLVTGAGFKYNMTDMQAAIGIHQLSRIDSYWERRREIWDYYNTRLAGLPIMLPEDPEPDTRHGYHLYTIRIDESKAGISRDAFVDGMTTENIGVGVHYLSIPEHPYYQERYGWQPDHYPNAMEIGRQTASLPLSARLKDEDVDDVIRAVVRVLDR